MDFDGTGAKLQELDDLDADLFSNIKTSKAIFKEEIVEKKKSLSEISDDDDNFDDSDIADLLNDDDDIFSKKTHPAKKDLTPSIKSPINNAYTESNEQKESHRESPKRNELSFTNNIKSKEKISEFKPNKTDFISDLDLHTKTVDDSDILKDLDFGSENKSTTKKDSSSMHDWLGVSSPKKSSLNKTGGSGKKDTIKPSDLSPIKETYTKPKESAPRKSSFVGSPKKVLSKDETDFSLHQKFERKGSILEDSADFLSNLDSEQLSPSKTMDNDDILEDLGLGTGKKAKKKESSFFDDLLGKASPKKTKNISNKNESLEDKETEEDAGIYIPTFGKRSETKSAPSSGTLQNRRGSYLKQVSFQSTSDSPKKTSLNKEQTSPRKQKSETDWDDFSKLLKKTEPPEFPIKNKATSETKEPVPKNELNSRRRSSSADWLQLSESKSEVAMPRRQDTPKKEKLEWLEPSETKTLVKSKIGSENPSSQTDNWLYSADTELANKTVSEKFQKDKKMIESPKNTKQGSSPKKKFEADDFFSSSIVKGKGNASFVTSEAPNVGDIKQQYSEPVAYSTFPPTYDVQNVHAKMDVNTDLMKNRAPQQVYAGIDPSTYNSLQVMLNNSILERDQLVKSSESMKLIYEEKINSTEMLLKNQIKAAEDSFQIAENRLKTEYGNKIQSLEEHLRSNESENKQLEHHFKLKLDDTEKQHDKEVKRLQELHAESVKMMKQDHEDALQRLKKLKDQEVEAISSTQIHTSSLQQLSDQLQERASELSALQLKMEEKNQLFMKEKQSFLDSKEKDLKALQNRLQRQLEESDDERIRLQQLVLRLESRLQKYAVEGEEDRWEVQQTKAKLSVQQKFLEEEQKIHFQQIEREKEKLRLSQDSLLHEQKTVLLQLAQERQQLIQEKLDVESLAKRTREEEARLNVKKMKEESSLETQRRLLQQEEDKVHWEALKAKQETQQMDRERNDLHHDKERFKHEREKLEQLRLSVQRRANEVEQMAMSASAEKEKAQVALKEARQIEMERHSKTEELAQQMQKIMEKERHIILEKEKLGEEKRELEAQKDNMLCYRCKLAINFPVKTLPPEIHQPQLAYPSFVNGMSNPTSFMNGMLNPTSFVNGIPNPTTVQSPLDPNLVVWYITAQKDREYLEKELTFLHSLKEP